MLTKHKATEVLRLYFKKAPVYFDWNFPISWSAITNFKILRSRRKWRQRLISLRKVPTIVIAQTFCASRDTQVSYT